VSRLPPLLVAFLLVPVVAWAQSSSEAPVTPPIAVVLLPLESNEEARDEAPGLTALLVSRLAESPRLAVSSRADQEVMRTAGFCTEGTCPEAMPGSPGSSKARYVVSGRLDRFGSRYLLTSSLMDSESGRALVRPRVEVTAVDSLPRAAVALADELLATLVQDPVARPSLPASSVSARPPRMGSFFLGLRFNNSLISNFASFNPGGDVEFGFQFHPEWMAFAQVGFTYVRAEADGHEGGLNVLPSVLGLRHYHNADGSFRPYWGFGIGVQLSFGEYGIFQQTGPLPTVIGFAGLEYLIAGHLGLQVEASTNIAQATLGLSDGGLGSGLNLDLNAGIAWHF
jgi:TolB-like protein